MLGLPHFSSRTDLFLKRVLRTIPGPKRDEVRREWRRIHNEELHALYSSPIIMWVIKSRRMKWARYGARMGEGINAYSSLVGIPEVEGHHVKDPCIDGRIILK
jgi:hypothetical protein